MTLPTSFLPSLFGDCPRTHSASSQREAANIFTISSGIFQSHLSPQLHLAQTFHLKQNPQSTSTRVLTTLLFCTNSFPCTPTKTLKLTHVFPVPPRFRMHQLTPTWLISSHISVSAPPTDLCRGVRSLDYI